MSVKSDNFICLFGAPRIIYSDQGRNFESSLFQRFCEILKIEKTRTSPLHPQSDGMVERFMRTLQVMLAAYCSKTQNMWDLWLPQVMMAYCSTVHASTGQTPHKMLFGREIRLPHEIIYPVPEVSKEEEESFPEYVVRLRKGLELTHEIARENLKASAKRQKTNYDHRSGSKATKLSAGESVWLFNPGRKKGICPKFTSPWKGPFLILGKLDDVCYFVQTGVKKSPGVIHVDRLRKYEGRVNSKWFKTALKNWATKVIETRSQD